MSSFLVSYLPEDTMVNPFLPLDIFYAYATHTLTDTRVHPFQTFIGLLPCASRRGSAGSRADTFPAPQMLGETALSSQTST